MLEISEQQLRWLTKGLTILPSKLVRKMYPHLTISSSTALTSMGKEKIRTEIEFIPAKVKVKVIDYYRESFQCLACRKEAHFSIEKPAMPQPVIAKSIASPSSVAHVTVQKYHHSIPLYQQEWEWKETGIHSSVMPSAERMQDGTSLKPSRRICRKKTFSAASAKKPSSESTSSLPLQKGLQDSRKKSAKNSVCERAIRNFTIGRKIWLFSDSPKGGK